MAFDLIRLLRAFLISEAVIKANKDRPLSATLTLLAIKDIL